MDYALSKSMDKPIVRYLVFVVFIIYMLLLSKYILFTRMHTAPENYFSWKHIQASVSKGAKKPTQNLFIQ
jgi:hypothetical protein